jgi:hypothetical protein
MIAKPQSIERSEDVLLRYPEISLRTASKPVRVPILSLYVSRREDESSSRRAGPESFAI